MSNANVALAVEPAMVILSDGLDYNLCSINGKLVFYHAPDPTDVNDKPLSVDAVNAGPGAAGATTFLVTGTKNQVTFAPAGTPVQAADLSIFKTSQSNTLILLGLASKFNPTATVTLGATTSKKKLKIDATEQGKINDFGKEVLKTVNQAVDATSTSVQTAATTYIGTAGDTADARRAKLPALLKEAFAKRYVKLGETQRMQLAEAVATGLAAGAKSAGQGYMALFPGNSGVLGRVFVNNYHVYYKPTKPYLYGKTGNTEFQFLEVPLNVSDKEHSKVARVKGQLVDTGVDGAVYFGTLASMQVLVKYYLMTSSPRYEAEARAQSAATRVANRTRKRQTASDTAYALEMASAGADLIRQTDQGIRKTRKRMGQAINAGKADKKDKDKNKCAYIYKSDKDTGFNTDATTEQTRASVAKATKANRKRNLLAASAANSKRSTAGS